MMPRLRTLIVVPCGLALASAAPDAQLPGAGVLCSATFIYLAERTGAVCHTGQDTAFQARLSRHAQRFDDYIIRNTGGDPAPLSRFKRQQGVDRDRAEICSGDLAENYEHLKRQPATDLDQMIDKLLATDGRPGFGDCV